MAAYLGLGTYRPSSEPTATDMVLQAQISVWIVVVQICYAISTAPIRSSIAAGLLRFSHGRPGYTSVLHLVMAISCITAIVTVIGATTQAIPLDEIWQIDPQTGILKYPLRTQWYSVLIYIVSVFLDAAIAIVSYQILWTTTLSFKTKLSIATLLGLGALAAISTLSSLILTIIFQEVVGVKGRAGLNITMIAELGVGITAGSAAALKLLFQKERPTTRDSSVQLNLMMDGQNSRGQEPKDRDLGGRDSKGQNEKELDLMEVLKST